MFWKKKNEIAPEIQWGDFYRHVIALIIPIALQNLVNVGIAAADVFMLGRVGEDVLAGAALAGQIQFIMVLCLFGLTSGLTIMTAQYWGKGDKATIEKILAMGIKVAIGVTLVFSFVAIVMPEFLLRIYTNEPEVIAQGVIYLRIVALSYVMIGFTQTYLFVMRSVERVKIATLVYSCSLFINVTLNFVLIFGVGEIIPAMGITGAAIGTVITRGIEVLFVIIYARMFNTDVRLRFRNFLKGDSVLRKDFIHYAMPVVINEILWGTAISVNAAILGRLGTAAIAANSVAQVSRQLTMVVAFGLTSATAIYLGKTIGENKLVEAKAYAKKFLQLSLIMGGIAATILLVASPHIIASQSLSAEAERYVRFMFFVMAYYVITQGFNATVIVGVLRAGGDTKFGMFADLFSMWFFTIPLGLLAAFVFQFSVPVVYIVLMSDELAKFPASIIRYRSGKWLKNVTREMNEIAE